MSAFSPHVQCLGALEAPLESCGYIVGSMKKDYGPVKFGRPWDKTINYALPHILTARKSWNAKKEFPETLALRFIQPMANAKLSSIH